MYYFLDLNARQLIIHIVNSHSKRTTGMMTVIAMAGGTPSVGCVSVGDVDGTTTAGVLEAMGTTQACMVDPMGQGIQDLAPNCG